MIYRIAETTSTNDDAKRPEYRHGDINNSSDCAYPHGFYG